MWSTTSSTRQPRTARQVEKQGMAKASAAAIRDDGSLVGQAVDAVEWARSSYRRAAGTHRACGLASGSTVLIAVDTVARASCGSVSGGPRQQES